MRHINGVFTGRAVPMLRNLAIAGTLIVMLLWSLQPGPSLSPAGGKPHTSNSDDSLAAAAAVAVAAAAPSANLTVTLVVARLSKDDTSWLSRTPPAFAHAVYTVDDPAAPLTVPMNKGHEVMTYLTYIITHYRALPALSIFLHAHQHAWHNAELLDRDMVSQLQRLRLDRVAAAGFANLRCEWSPGCPQWLDLKSDPEIAFKMEEKAARATWAELHPGARRPDFLAQPCCSQFVASREVIRRVPLAEWERYRKWLIETSLSDNLAGRVWEYTWQWVFSGKSVLCPSAEACYCENYGVCFGEDGKGYETWTKLRDGKKSMREQMDEEEKLRAEEQGWGNRKELIRLIESADREQRAIVEEAIKRGDEVKNAL